MGTVALAGGGEGAVEQKLRPYRLLAQQGAGHPADADRTGGVGAGGAHHHGTQDVEQVHKNSSEMYHASPVHDARLPYD